MAYNIKKSMRTRARINDLPCIEACPALSLITLPHVKSQPLQFHTSNFSDFFTNMINACVNDTCITTIGGICCGAREGRNQYHRILCARNELRFLSGGAEMVWVKSANTIPN